MDDEVEPAPVGSRDIRGVRGDEPLLWDNAALATDCLTGDPDPGVLENVGSASKGAAARAGRGVVTEAVKLSAAAVGAGPLAAEAGGQRQGKSQAPPQGKVHVLWGKGGGGVSRDGLQPCSGRGTGLRSQQRLLRGSKAWQQLLVSIGFEDSERGSVLPAMAPQRGLWLTQRRGGE